MEGEKGCNKNMLVYIWFVLNVCRGDVYSEFERIQVITFARFQISSCFYRACFYIVFLYSFYIVCFP